MRKTDHIQAIRDAQRRQAERPASERFAEMVARGIIDRKGRVRRYMPAKMVSEVRNGRRAFFYQPGVGILWLKVRRVR